MKIASWRLTNETTFRHLAHDFSNTKNTLDPILWAPIRIGRTPSLGVRSKEMLEEDHGCQVMAGVSANSSDKCDIE
eukprot:scaffold3217_cov71-Skeletonema_menzelii.AAC.2